MAAPMWYQFIRSSIFTLIILGVSASLYAYYVEKSKELDANFKAACDISTSMSCSKVFTSKWGRGFGLLEYVVGKDSVLNQPNSIFGLVFYVIQTVLTLQNTLSACKTQIGLSVIANIGSVYLAYILYFILHDLCVVCLSTYIINFCLLLACVWRYFYLHGMITNRRRKKLQ